MHSEQSIFASLHKWARGQDENYCTEGLIYLLRLMMLEAPVTALRLTAWLTVGMIDEATRPQSITISGQVFGDEGKPDVEIQAGSKKVWIEVKVDSKVAPTQLERYRRMLSRHTGESRLILLSRGHDELSERNRPDHSLRWLDLAGELERARHALDKHSNAAFLIADYLAFLGTKQMKLNAVSPRVNESITDVGTLMTQIKLACDALGWKTTVGFANFALGYTIRDGSERLGNISFNLEEPRWLFFTTEGGTAEAESRLNLELAQECPLPGACMMGKHWTNSLDLIECREYLEASAADQVEQIQRHLIESVNALRQMLTVPT